MCAAESLGGDILKRVHGEMLFVTVVLKGETKIKWSSQITSKVLSCLTVTENTVCACRCQY